MQSNQEHKKKQKMASENKELAADLTVPLNGFHLFLKKCQALELDSNIHEVEAIVIGGSVGRWEMDIFSDVDLFILVSDCNISDFLHLKMRTLASLLGRVLLFRGPVFKEVFGYSFTVLYDTFLTCQFNVNSRSTLTASPMCGLEHRVLFDKTGYCTDFLRNVKGLEVDEQTIFLESFSFFWLRARGIWKDIKRNDLWLAIRHLSDLRDQMFILERLLRRTPPPGLNFQLPSKRIEKDLGQEISCLFRQTLCDYSRESIRDAFLFCIRWFLEDAIIYLSREGANCEDELKVASHLVSMIERDLT